MGNAATADPKANGKGASAPATPPARSIAQARAARAKAQAEGVSAKKQDPRERYTLAEGETWHELATGGYVGITTSESGVESIVETSGQGRVKRGVSVLGVTTLIEAERL